MDYSELTDDAKETLKGMVEFCINNGFCMGMNEGLNEDYTKKQFRLELEKFCEYKG